MYHWPATTAGAAKRKPRMIRPCRETFVLSHASGFYLAAFASNVDFDDEVNLELDPQIGYTAPIALGSIHPAVDLGMLRYNYIGNSDLNYNEYYFKMIFNALLHQNDSFTPSISLYL